MLGLLEGTIAASHSWISRHQGQKLKGNKTEEGGKRKQEH